ncbi:MAG: hypothetical protein AMXMBFR84_35170 [Candidatus Hydrogenedentota bacterium]
MEVAVLECTIRGKTEVFTETVLDRSLSPDVVRLFVVSGDRIAEISRLFPALRNLAPGKNQLNLQRTFNKLREGECGTVYRDYVSLARMRSSMKTLLSNMRHTRRNVTCIVQIPPRMYTQLEADVKQLGIHRSTFSGSAGSPASLYLQILPDVDIPPYLEANYIGASRSVQFVRRMIVLASRQNVPVLIQGDSGTGKEIVARMVHRCRFNGAEDKDFKPVNCSSIPDSLLESELFGHVSGAFTDGKNTRDGLWKAANDGTLFLDEIGELSMSSQAKILRAIETNTVRPVGADKDEPVKANLIMATNRDLFAMTKRGEFREDLFFRIWVGRIVTPPLREHPEDIPLLANFLWNKITNQNGVTLPDAVTECLAEYPWPGNVRELQSVLRSMCIAHGNAVTTRKQVEFAMDYAGVPANEFFRADRAVAKSTRRATQLKQTLKAQEAIAVLRALVGQVQNCPTPGLAVQAGLPLSIFNVHRDLLTLCEDPLSFGSTEIYKAVLAFGGKLGQYLLAVDANPDTIGDRATCLELLSGSDALEERLTNYSAELVKARRS